MSKPIGQMNELDCLRIMVAGWFGVNPTNGTIPFDPSEGGGQLVIQSSAVTSGGTVMAGALSVSFVTSSDFSGTINGAAFPASASKSFNAPNGASLPSIAYTRSAGTLYIDAIVRG